MSIMSRTISGTAAVLDGSASSPERRLSELEEARRLPALLDEAEVTLDVTATAGGSGTERSEWREDEEEEEGGGEGEGMVGTREKVRDRTEDMGRIDGPLVSWRVKMNLNDDCCVCSGKRRLGNATMPVASTGCDI